MYVTVSMLMAVVRLSGPTLPPMAAAIVGQRAAAPNPSNARSTSKIHSFLPNVMPNAAAPESREPITIIGRLPNRSPRDPIGDLKIVSTTRNPA